jgi:putative transposase
MIGETQFITLQLQHEYKSYCVDHADLFIDAVDAAVRRDQLYLHALCLLPNHIHIAATLAHNTLHSDELWRAICADFSECLAERSGIRARLTLRRLGILRPEIKVHRIRSRRELSEIRYRIYQDPVRHGLVSHADDWLYSNLRGDKVPSGLVGCKSTRALSQTRVLVNHAAR